MPEAIITTVSEAATTTASEATATTANPQDLDKHSEFVQQFDRPTETTRAVVTAGQGAGQVEPDRMEKFLHPLQTMEVVIGVSTIFFWNCFFLAGIVVETASVRATVTERLASSVVEELMAWLTLLTSYTVTNFAILACLAAMIGKFSRRALSFETATLEGLSPAPAATLREVWVFYSVATARGFVIYLALTGGLILLSTSTVTESSIDEYIKLASTISIMAFMAGYDSEVFKRAIDRFAKFSPEVKPKS